MTEKERQKAEEIWVTLTRGRRRRLRPNTRKREPSPDVELLLKALRVAGSTQRLAEWMQTPIPALNGHTPYQLIQSEQGRKEVDAVLGRIEHGVY